jgi:predicted nucleotidyltransferase component of viral defense system
MDDSKQLESHPLMQLEAEIRKKARETGTQQGVIEKDFALGYILAGIASTPVLNETLVFKGGTALKKCYFGNYRFSEDLDFSTLDAPRKAALKKALSDALSKTDKLLSELGPFELELRPYPEKQPNPKDQEAYSVGIRFPWQKQYFCSIKIEISHHEPVLLPPEARSLIHLYGTPLETSVNCYPLDEVVAEKMRTLLQTHQKLLERSWNRPRARDYYDLWHIFTRYGDTLNPERLPGLLEQKAAHAEVSFSNVTDFFTAELIKEAQKNWDSNLGAFVNDLPPCDTVLLELQTLVPRYFPNLT